VESHLASLLDSLEAEGAEKIEECYAYAKTFFKQHWTLNSELARLVFENYKSAGMLRDAVNVMQQRVAYMCAVMPCGTYTSAWAWEELGDLLTKLFKTEPSVFLKNEAMDAYRTSYTVFIVLCGREHGYTCAAYQKYLDATHLDVLENRGRLLQEVGHTF